MMAKLAACIWLFTSGWTFLSGFDLLPPPLVWHTAMGLFFAGIFWPGAWR